MQDKGKCNYVSRKPMSYSVGLTIYCFVVAF